MFAWPAGTVAGLTTHPAAHGALLIVYATGLGPVTPPVDDGAASGSVLTQVNTQPVVTIGGVTAPVAFAGLQPQFPGVYQLNITVPANAPAGNAVPIQIQVGGVVSPASFTIAAASSNRSNCTHRGFLALKASSDAGAFFSRPNRDG